MIKLDFPTPEGKESRLKASLSSRPGSTSNKVLYVGKVTNTEGRTAIQDSIHAQIGKFDPQERIETKRVGSVTTSERIIPLVTRESVVASISLKHIVSCPAVETIVSITTKEQVVSALL